MMCVAGRPGCMAGRASSRRPVEVPAAQMMWTGFTTLHRTERGKSKKGGARRHCDGLLRLDHLHALADAVRDRSW
jgi:hypothetical protein